MTGSIPIASAARAPVASRAGRIGYLCTLWALLYGVLALVWTLTGDGYPFREEDTNGGLNVLRLLPADAAAPVFAGFALLTAVVAVAMSGGHAVHPRGLPRRILLGYGWLAAAVLLLVIPDTTVLALTGYAPMLLIGAPFGWPDVDYSTVFTWTLANQLYCALGGVLLALTVLAWQRRTAGLCTACGRGDAARAWNWAASAARWGRWATYAAAAIPVVYALTRFSWLAGIPIGMSAEEIDSLRDSGAVWAGAGLATFAVVGAILTLGLVRRWGEVFPRWMIGLAGRRVPIKLAVTPATYVALAVAAASIAFLSDRAFVELMVDFNAAAAPMLLWPLWSVALGVATWAYYVRRRGRCSTCGRRLSHRQCQSRSGATSEPTNRTKPSGSGSSRDGSRTTVSAPASAHRRTPAAIAAASPVTAMSASGPYPQRSRAASICRSAPGPVAACT